MEHWILSVNPNGRYYEEAQKEWAKYGILIRLVSTMEQAIEQASCHDFLLIYIISENGSPQYLSYLPILRDAVTTPIYIISDSENDHDDAIQQGADLFRANLSAAAVQSNVASGWGIIRRDLNVRKKRSITTLQYEEFFMCVEYRTVFAYGVEVTLTRTEFEMLRLLLSNPKRVFTYAQIYRRIWNDNYESNIKRSVFNQASKLRKKIKTVLKSHVYVSNIHDMGYRLAP